MLPPDTALKTQHTSAARCTRRARLFCRIFQQHQLSLGKWHRHRDALWWVAELSVSFFTKQYCSLQNMPCSTWVEKRSRLIHKLKYSHNKNVRILFVFFLPTNTNAINTRRPTDGTRADPQTHSRRPAIPRPSPGSIELFSGCRRALDAYLLRRSPR